MNERTRLAVLLCVCAVLLIVGLAFSIRLTDGVSAVAQREATQHAPVPTPAAHAPPKPAQSHA